MGTEGCAVGVWSLPRPRADLARSAESPGKPRVWPLFHLLAGLEAPSFNSQLSPQISLSSIFFSLT